MKHFFLFITGASLMVLIGARHPQISLEAMGLIIGASLITAGLMGLVESLEEKDEEEKHYRRSRNNDIRPFGLR